MISEEMDPVNIRGLFDFNFAETPVPLDEVESVDSIVKRFKTGAMSYGSISQEAHETLAIAMNQLHGKSNSGEGGESLERLLTKGQKVDRCSAIKQVASGRFGVTSRYLTSANEIQIKMAQGAKPGEGGHLPGKRFIPGLQNPSFNTGCIAHLSPTAPRYLLNRGPCTAYLRPQNSNKDARISVKLVSECGVGTVAAGVAKAGAGVILISGYDGGTGAAPRNSIYNAGLPWELGLAEAHQTLIMNDLRNKVVIETDGKLMNGRDVAIAAMLGAEEFGFATAPLVTLGCAMMRVCNLDTCPFGVATQNPELRKRFCGKPEYVINFMKFVASELREYMSKLGVKPLMSLSEELTSSREKKASQDRLPRLTFLTFLTRTLFRKRLNTTKRAFTISSLNQHLTRESSAKNLQRFLQKAQRKRLKSMLRTQTVHSVQSSVPRLQESITTTLMMIHLQ